MELEKFLSLNKEELLNKACQSLSRASLRHYSSSEESENRKRLEKLLELTTLCIGHKKLLPMINYMEETSRERFYAGFDFGEVHSAINVLEESVWKKINSSLAPPEVGEALGLVSTVLGAAKESLARTYIGLASKSKVSSLDLNAMFERS